MANIFPRWTNRIPLALGVGLPLALCAIVGIFWYWFSPWFLNVGYRPEQPVPFSHRLHAGRLGMDCQYCHNTVEKASHAAVPPTGTCNNCHSQIRKDSPKLAKVRDSVETGESIPWIKVHQLADYAYFNHSAHVASGVGCKSCHGRIDQMREVSMAKPLSMSWCLDCHRNPEPHLRPKDEVTNMEWDVAKADYDPHADPERTRDVNPPTHCSGCHR